MPKETKSVSSFDRGIISNVAPTDLPDDACLLAPNITNGITVNIDPNASGKLIGMPSPEDKLTGSYNYNGRDFFGWIEKDDGKFTLVYNMGAASVSRYIEDFYGTPGATTATGSWAVYSMVTRNQEIYGGTYSGTGSTWMGYIDKGQFGNAASTSFLTYDQKVEHFHFDGIASGRFVLYPLLITHASSFDGSTYYWAYSLIFDGYQESPLYYASDLNQAPTSAQSVVVRVSAIAAYSTPSSFNKRISGVRVYRAKSADGTFSNRGFFRLIKEIDINDTTVADRGTATSTSVGKLVQLGQNFLTTVSVGDLVFNSTDTTSANVVSVDSDTELTLSGDIMASGEAYTIYSGFGRSNATDLQFSFLDDGSVEGASYEAQTGIAETLEDTSIDYKLGTSVNDYHFVADCVLPSDQIVDGAHFLVRSKRGRFSIFDWTKDFLRLPTIPVAMAGYGGKLFVWDESRTYVVNPEGLFIEDTLEGAGCRSQTCWVATDYGLFWADSNRAYRFLGNDLRTISDPIENIMGDINTPDQVIFDAEHNIVMFYSTILAMCFHVVRERWDFISPMASSVTGAFTGKNGETYTCGGNKIILNFKSGLVESGATTSAATNKLIDATQNFLTTVSSGMRVVNLNKDTSATVSSVDSNTQLTLSADIMSSSDNYNIYYPSRMWLYSSPEFTFGEPGQDKKFYKAYIKKNGFVTESFSLNGSGEVTTIGTDDKLDINGEWARGKTLRLQLAGAVNSSVDYYEILFRRLKKL